MKVGSIQKVNFGIRKSESSRILGKDRIDAVYGVVNKKQDSSEKSTIS